MKHKSTFIFSLITAIIFFTILLTCILISISIDVNDQLTIAFKESNWDSAYQEKIRENVNSPFDLVNFLFGFEGFTILKQNHSINVQSLTVLWLFVFPSISIIFALAVIINISLFLFERIRKEYIYKNAKFIGKWGMYISFSLFIIFMLTSLIIASKLQNDFSSTNLIAFEENQNNTFSYFVVLKYLTSGHLVGILNSSDNLNIDLPSNLITSWFVLMVVICPIIGASLLIFTSIWYSSFTCSRGYEMSKFKLWLRNIRIDSKKDYFNYVFKNIWLWILFLISLLSLLIPGLVHPYTNKDQAFITIFAIVGFLLALTPFIIGYIKAINLSKFNFNILMYAQIWIFWLFITIFNLTIWTLQYDQINMPTFMITIYPFILIMISTISLFGFVKFQKR